MKKRKSKRRIFPILLTAFFSLLAVMVVITGVYLQRNFERELPSDFFSMSVKGESPVFFVYRFEDRTNRVGTPKEITENIFFQEQASYTSFDELPPHLINAFVAIEDKRFWDHSGVDWYRTLAASANYILGFSESFGASTITQQLVKNVTGNAELTPKRKLQEILYARDLEKKLDKSQILELYLNVIHFSDHCDGIGDAAPYHPL